MNGEIDVRGVLPSIRVPTLVLHRTGDRAISVRAGRSMAEAIPGAAFVELRATTTCRGSAIASGSFRRSRGF
jgi:pimeloyl-ACP methyl ester carboxylesterase